MNLDDFLGEQPPFNVALDVVDIHLRYSNAHYEDDPQLYVAEQTHHHTQFNEQLGYTLNKAYQTHNTVLQTLNALPEPENPRFQPSVWLFAPKFLVQGPSIYKLLKQDINRYKRTAEKFHHWNDIVQFGKKFLAQYDDDELTKLKEVQEESAYTINRLANTATKITDRTRDIHKILFGSKIFRV